MSWSLTCPGCLLYDRLCLMLWGPPSVQAPAPGRVACNMTFSMHKNIRYTGPGHRHDRWKRYHGFTTAYYLEFVFLDWRTKICMRRKWFFCWSQADGGYVSEGKHQTDKWFSYFTGKIFEIILRVKYLNEIYFRLIIPEINPMQTVMTLYLFKGACDENMFVKEYTIFHRFNHFIWVDYQVASQPIWRPVKSCCQSSGLVTRDWDRIVATHCYKQTRSARIPRVLHIPT